MSEIDKKIINILINNKKELNDFANDGGEGIFDNRYQRFVKNILLYHKAYNSCPTLNTFIEFVGKNESLRENIKKIWEETNELGVDNREFTYLLDKMKTRYNKDIFSIIKDKFNDSIGDVDDTNNFLYKVVNEIQNIGKKSVFNEVVLRTSVKDWLGMFRVKAENKEIAQGVLTGFKTIDYYLNGLKSGELMIYGADSGAGKSIFLINLATNCFLGRNELPKSKDDAKTKLWEKANNVLLISIEMNANEVQNRILSCMCDINSLNLDKGIIAVDEADRLKRALAYWEYGPGNLKIVDIARGAKASTVQDVYDNCCLEFKPDIIIIDYLGLMTDNAEDSDADWLKLKDVAEQLHELSRVNGVPIVSAVQLKVKKAGEGSIGLHAIGRSSMIAHNANFVIQAEYRENEQDRTDLKLHMIKNRRGCLFSFTTEKQFQFSKLIDNGSSINKDSKVLSNEDLTEAMDMLLKNEKDEI